MIRRAQQPDRVEYRGRSATAAGIEVRDNAEGQPVFTGHASVTDTRTSIGNPLTWGFYEEIAAGAFDRTLSECDARFLVDHDTSKVVARQSAGDLRLAVDGVGLGTEADLDTEVSYISDLARNVSKRRITGMSFGFMVRADEWSTVDVTATDDNGKDFATTAELRRITDLDLVEVSAVTFPAYEETDAALRALQLNPGRLSARMDTLRGAHQSINKRLIGRALDLMTDLRAGKMLSAANVDLLQSILDQLGTADEAIDGAERDLSGLLGVADPDDDDTEADGDDASRSSLNEPPALEHMRLLAARHGLSRP